MKQINLVIIMIVITVATVIFQIALEFMRLLKQIELCYTHREEYRLRMYLHSYSILSPGANSILLSINHTLQSIYG